MVVVMVLGLVAICVKCIGASRRKKSAKTENLLRELAAIDLERQNDGQLWSSNNPLAGEQGGTLHGATWADEAL